MAPLVANVRERRRTYEGRRDLHRTRLVLAAVSGGPALRGRGPPSFGPIQEDLRICFETTEDGKESRVDRASGTDRIAAHNRYCAPHHRGPWGWSQDVFSEGLATGPIGSPGNRGNHAPCDRSEGGCVDCRRQ